LTRSTRLLPRSPSIQGKCGTESVAARLLLDHLYFNSEPTGLLATLP
jgi:hypothetical protein